MTAAHEGTAEEADFIDARHAEGLLEAGALQSAIFNSANFSSIATRPSASSSEAWERCRDERYDAITLDLLLPDMKPVSEDDLIGAFRRARVHTDGQRPILVVDDASG